MLKTIFRATVIAQLIFATAGAYAQDDPRTVIRAHLAGEGTTAKEINEAPIAGMYEVVLPDNTIIYATKDGKYFFIGDILDVVNKKAITRERVAQLGVTDFPTLPHELAIKSGDIGAKTKVFVISDPNCPYCRRYYKKLKATPGIEIDTLLVAVLGQDSQRKAMSIMCAANPKAAYEASVEGTVVAEATCERGEKALRASYEWMKVHPVKTTPTSIFNDGKTETGELSEDQIVAHLASKK